MEGGLPGSATGKPMGAAVVKAALRLVGGADLADAIADLTGLSRKRVKALVAQAVIDLSDTGPEEFRALPSHAERSPAEHLLVQAFTRAAATRKGDIPVAALIGPDQLVRLVTDDETVSELTQWSENEQGYFRALAHRVAELTCGWYLDDSNARAHATAAGVGQLLRNQAQTPAWITDSVDATRELRESQVNAPGATDHASAADPPSEGRDGEAIAEAAWRALGAPPAYYPLDFTTEDLAADLAVARIDVQTRGFDSHGLYWDGYLDGAPEEIDDVLAANSLAVILGNPGAGKTTLAKYLTLQRIGQRLPAAYARLDDLETRLEGGASTYVLDVGLAVVAASMSHAIRATVSPSFLAFEPGQPSPLIVLDGLDEVTSASGRDEIQRLAALLSDHGYTVVITSRISGYTAPWAEAVHLAVLPLIAPSPAGFADRWFSLTGDDVARQRHATAASNPAIASVLTNPLTLGFVCFVAMHEEIPTTEAAIFERFIDHFIRRSWHEPDHWITDSARVAAITLAATDLAWAMSRIPYGAYQQRWTDAATLAELEDLSSSVDAPQMVYAAGLLIAHGRVAPTSERYQSVRWLHRVIHEHFTARRLARLITGGTSEEAWADLLLAVLHPSWSATLHQTGQLLFETPDLHSLLDDLQHRAETRDTPNRGLAGGLELLAPYCTCRRRRRRIARFLAASGAVSSAFQLEPETTTDALLSGEADLSQYGSWLFASHPATRTLPLLERLHQAGLLAAMYRGTEALWNARVASDPHRWWPLAVQAARMTGTISMPNVDDCPPEILVFMADELIGQIAHGPGVLSAWELRSLDEPLMTELAKRSGLPSRIALAVAIHLYNNSGRRDYVRLAAKMTGPLHPEDVRLLAADLEQEVGWTHFEPLEKDWVHLARAASYFDGFPGDGSWHLDPPATHLSLPLAEAIINARQPDSLPDTPSQIESLIWAFCVLAETPSARVLDTFLAWDDDTNADDSRIDASLAPWDRAAYWMDAASYTAVKNSLDWTALVGEARRDIAEGQRLGRAGGILATAAEIWSTPHAVRPSDRHRISADDALDLWLEGLTLQLQHGSGGFQANRWSSLPEGASEELLIDCAIAVLNLTSDRTDPIATSARKGAERTLAGAGALAHFYDEIAIPRPGRERG
ncbi:NACHT domain-containing protein [Kribbella sp. ALI-6-A]|uniref:NACHT domain-containing protein n=1 Tax=Kribbella sp. ALI-6-A TaxID=1933817 RepID=UPI00117B9879|nr:hypothetical protein [Kribbella sp. ALI-6-A]